VWVFCETINYPNYTISFDPCIRLRPIAYNTAFDIPIYWNYKQYFKPIYVHIEGHMWVRA